MTRGAQRDKDRARADARANKGAKGTGSGGGGLAQAAKGQSDAAALAAKKEMKAKLKAEGKIKEKTGGTKAPPKSKVKNAVRLGHDEGKRMRLGLCPCVSVCCAVMCGVGEVCVVRGVDVGTVVVCSVVSIASSTPAHRVTVVMRDWCVACVVGLVVL